MEKPCSVLEGTKLWTNGTFMIMVTNWLFPMFAHHIWNHPYSPYPYPHSHAHTHLTTPPNPFFPPHPCMALHGHFNRYASFLFIPISTITMPTSSYPLPTSSHPFPNSYLHAHSQHLYHYIIPIYIPMHIAIIPIPTTSSLLHHPMYSSHSF